MSIGLVSERVQGESSVGLSFGAYLTATSERGPNFSQKMGRQPPLKEKKESHLITLYLSGSLIQFSPFQKTGTAGPGGRRRGISSFSRASKRRLMKELGTYDRQALSKAKFVTLTYPSKFPNPKEAKKHLDTFLKRLRRAYPHAGGTWKLELQERGAPHFHLLVLGVEFLPHTWVSKAWYEVVKSGDAKHLLAGTEVRQVEKYSHCVYYVSKYIGKQVNIDLEGLGRVWGKFGAWKEQVSETVTLALPSPQVARFARTLDGLRRSYQRRKGRKLKRKSFMRQGAFWFADVGKVYPVLPRLLPSCRN